MVFRLRYKGYYKICLSDILLSRKGEGFKGEDITPNETRFDLLQINEFLTVMIEIN